MSIIVPCGYNVLRLLSIDPSSTCVGVSRFLADNITNRIIDIKSGTINLDSYNYDTMLLSEIHGDKNIRLVKLEYKMKELIDSIQPDVVVCESAFFNPSRPNAFASLTEVIWLLRRLTINYNPYIRFVTLPPKTIKEAIGSMKITDKGKDPVKEAIVKIPEVYNLIHNFIDSLDNHAIDSVAIGYTFFKKYGDY